ncbi:unnamed protein product [Musa hybrid cultivar]
MKRSPMFLKRAVLGLHQWPPCWLGQASHLNSLFLTTLGRPTASESIRQPWLMGSLTFFFVCHHIFQVGLPLPVYPFASVARVLLRFIALLLQVKCPFTLA